MQSQTYSSSFRLSSTLSGTSSTLHRLLRDLGGGSTSLGLCGRLLGLLVPLLSLGLGDGGSSGSGSNFRLGSSLGHDRGEVGTDDSTLKVSDCSIFNRDGWDVHGGADRLRHGP